jgi:hypothetical protein
MTHGAHNTVTPCKVKCAGGGDCICNNTPGHPHTLHVCRDPDCACHTAAYHMEQVTDRNGKRLYIPTGARLVAPRGRR